MIVQYERTGFEPSGVNNRSASASLKRGAFSSFSFVASSWILKSFSPSRWILRACQGMATSVSVCCVGDSTSTTANRTCPVCGSTSRRSISPSSCPWRSVTFLSSSFVESRSPEEVCAHAAPVQKSAAAHAFARIEVPFIAFVRRWFPEAASRKGRHRTKGIGYPGDYGGCESPAAFPESSVRGST